MVWINAEAHKTNYATPAELSTVADRVTKVYRYEAATVYYVKSR